VTAPRFGFLASGLRPQGLPPASELRRLGPRLEELGWDSVWVADRLASPAPGSPLLEGVTMAAVYSALTTRLRVGIGVLVAPTRHPFALAKQLATIDIVAEGRLVAGLGIGINPADYASVEVPFRQRGRRQNELIEVLRRAWTSEGPVRFQGRHFRVEDVWLEPGPHRPGGPPIWIGGTSDAALRRAGRLGDGWLAFQVAPEQVPGMLRVIRRQAERSGRDPDAIECGLLVAAHVRADGGVARREAEEIFSRRWGRAAPPGLIEQLCIVGDPRECVEKVAAFAQAGVGELVLNPQSWTRDPVADAEQLMADLVGPARAQLS
jgi:probable F420-dependent oxidoreductase